MAPEKLEPTIQDILASIRAIIRGEPPTFLKPKPSEETMETAPARPPCRGLSPGLLLMAVVALVITILAAVKNMK